MNATKLLQSRCLKTAMWLALSVVAAHANPTLTVGSSSGTIGSTVTLPITFDPSTSSVAGIQFNLNLPTGFSTGPVTAGTILTTAAKSVSTNATGNTWTFIIFGLNQ